MRLSDYLARLPFIGIAILLALAPYKTAVAVEPPKVTDLDIASGIIDALKSDTLTEEAFATYIDKNGALLKNNVDQALLRFKKESAREIVSLNFEKYIQNKDIIIANWESFAKAKETVAEKIAATFSDDIPGVVLVPCVGLYANGGWADTIDGTRYIFAAPEMIPPQFDVGSLLIHEITHGISEVDWNILLDGIYNEGLATYVSYKLSHGMPMPVYFLMSPPKIDACYDWMNANREKIAEDMSKPLEVMNDMHKFYLTTSYSDYPNIGYIIGFEYIKHLNGKYSLEDLRTFAMNVDKNKAEFVEFLKTAEFGAGNE